MKGPCAAFASLLLVVACQGDVPSGPTVSSGSGWGGEPCTTRLGGLAFDGPARLALRVGQKVRVAVDIQKPSAGCSRATGDFERLTWVWGRDSVEVRLVECPACTVEYADRVTSHGSVEQVEGSARLEGPQRVDFEITGLAPGVDVLAAWAQRCPGESCHETSADYLELDVSQ